VGINRVTFLARGVVQFRVELIRQGNGLWPQFTQFAGEELQVKF